MIIFSKEKKKDKKTNCDILGINPHKYWAFLIKTFYYLLLILILFGFYLFYEINNEKIFQVNLEVKTNNNLLNENLLNKIENTFDIKERKEFNMNHNFSTYKDPSL